MNTPRSLHRPVALILTVACALSLAQIAPSRRPDPFVEAAAREAARAPDAGEPRINPNTATPHELESLPGVGPSIAARIVQERLRGRGFSKPDDLLSVRGIGPRTLARMAPMLTFDAGATGPR